MAVHTMLEYGTAINRHKPVHTCMYHHVQLVTILANSAFQRSALVIWVTMYQYMPPIALYVLIIALKSRIR